MHNNKSTIAPIRQQCITVFILPLGYNTCIPITFEIPTIKMIGAIICDANVAGMNSWPHKTLMRFGAVTNKPQVRGRHMAIVKSYDFCIKLLNSTSLCSDIRCEVLGIITTPRQDDNFIITDIIFVV